MIAAALGYGAQALQLVETKWQAVGPDMLLSGYLPAAGGLWGLHGSASPQSAEQLPAPAPHLRAATDQPATTAAASTSSDSSADAALLAGAAHRRPDQVDFATCLRGAFGSVAGATRQREVLIIPHHSHDQ